MIKKTSLNNLIIELWKSIDHKKKYQIFLLLLLILLTSLSEIVSIGAIIPFISIIINPDKVLDFVLFKELISFFKIEKIDDLRFILTILFCSSVVLSSFLRLYLLKSQTMLAHSIGAEISIKIYNNSLNQKYIDHLNNNSSNLISAIIEKSNMVVRQVILPFLLIVSSIIILFAILTTLIYLSPKLTIITFLIFFIIYISIFVIIRNKLQRNSKIIDKLSISRIKALQEGLGGIKHVILNALQNYFSKVYRDSDLPLRRAQAINSIITQSPKYLIEAIGLVLIATIAYFFANSGDNISNYIPILGAFALGAQRMLPLLQAIYANLSQIKGSEEVLKAVLLLLKKKNNDYSNRIDDKFNLNFEIYLKDISFKYSEKLPLILNKIDFKIKKGQKIGIVGNTGSGKTTFINVIMGLLQPTTGSIYVDGTEINDNNVSGWMKNIAYVPQSIFLADTTIRENIAFGVPKNEINNDLIHSSIQKAQLSKFINDLKNGLDEIVGERGIRISGGQLQRIGIARALYKKATLIILDEATSALDDNTESKVMETVYNLDKNITLIMIAHRTSSLKNCDLIIKINNGMMERI